MKSLMVSEIFNKNHFVTAEAASAAGIALNAFAFCLKRKLKLLCLTGETIRSYTAQIALAY